MIPIRYLEEWKENAPWPSYAQIEQDMIISRALVEIFSDDLLKKSLALPINPILKRIRERLSFLGTKRTVKQHIHNNTIIYRFETEIQPIVNMRLKIEINTREHFNVLGLKEIPYKIANTWFSGECNLTGYELEELLGTKLRALYQRRKGRDLFDLYWVMTHQDVDAGKIVRCYKKYMEYSVDKPPTQKQFLANMEEKIMMKEFTDDVHLILKKGVLYDDGEAWEVVRKTLIERI
jgi:predicted nucleotidyltransferase component of viral defense system